MKYCGSLAPLNRLNKKYRLLTPNPYFSNVFSPALKEEVFFLFTPSNPDKPFLNWLILETTVFMPFPKVFISLYVPDIALPITLNGVTTAPMATLPRDAKDSFNLSIELKCPITVSS